MKSLPPLLTMVAVAMLLFAGYGGAYLGTGYLGMEVDELNNTIAVERTYSHAWLPSLFKPAAWIESSIFNVPVITTYAGSQEMGCGNSAPSDINR